MFIEKLNIKQNFMKTIANWVRRILFKILPLESYLNLLSKMYFVSFRLNLLKNNQLYIYPYFLKNVIKKGDICIDIGANLGYFSTLLSKLAGPDGKVYAVEPIKQVLSVLRRNTRKLKNVEILPFALGEENKTIQLGNNTINTSGFMASGSNKVISAETETDIRFDAEMKKGSEVFGNLEKLDFIKIDIEGYEAIVLLELEPVISKHRPTLLIETRRENRVTLLKFFKEKGYNSYILENNLLIPATPENYWDIITIPSEKKDFLREFIVP